MYMGQLKKLELLPKEQMQNIKKKNREEFKL